MATPGPAQWHSADLFVEDPRSGAEAAGEPHEAIRDNFSRILEGPSQTASPWTHGIARTASQILEAPRVWLESPLRPARGPALAAAGSPESLPAYGAAGRKAEPVTKRIQGQASELTETFPRIFTCVCFIVFMTPIYLTIRIGRDTNVRYWFGPWCYIAAFLPCLFILGHIVHSNKRQPHKPTVLVCLIVPAVTLLILGECVFTSISDKANQLFSTDCDTFAEKRALEREHLAAQNVFATCLADTVSQARVPNLTLEHAAELYRIQDCEEYESELQAHQRDWTYLRHMEEEHKCAGWCNVGEPVWTFGEVRDSCSVAASTIFDGKIKHMASQVVVYNIIVIFIVSIGLLVVGPSLRQAGIAW